MMRIDKTTTLLSLAFAVVTGMMILLAGIGLSVIHAAKQHLEDVVKTSNAKTELLLRMQAAGRQRTISLQKMLLSDDVFERDAEWSRMRDQASNYLDARQKLMSMQLDTKERALLAAQRQLTHINAPAQEHLAQLALAGRLNTARDELINTVLPGQDRFMAVLARLRALNNREMMAKMDESHTAYQNALLKMLIISGAITALSILIALAVIRRTRDVANRLAREKERAQVTLHSIGDGVITSDRRGNIKHMNVAAERLTGWTLPEARGKPVAEVLTLVHESSTIPVDDPVARVLHNGQVVQSQADVALIRRDGHNYAIEHTVAPVFDHWQNHISGTVLVFRDVTEMRALSRQLIYQAQHDALTGLLSRREFEQRLQEILVETRRYPNDQHWLCYVDLDQFKVINDTCGHLAGDELLKQLSATLRNHVRDSDLVARMGGDEFAILCKHCDAKEAHDTIERLRLSVSKLRFSWDDKCFTTSASIGMAPITAHSGSVHDLLSVADTACYVAKDEGRNRIHMWAPDDTTLAQREGEMQWVHRIQQALQDDRFELYFQRIAPLQIDDSQMHCEILLRLRDPTGQLVAPMAFIPAAERYNLMVQVDRWVLCNAVSRMHELLSGREQVQCSIAINLSAQSLCDDDFLPFVLKKLDVSNIDARRLCFEITETAAITNLSRAQQFIHTLKARGCRFALDDFGSGLSSFGYLKNLPVDYLKIDGSFVRGIGKDNVDRALVEAINQIGHVLGIETVAEYVDNDAALNVLRKMGVDYGQGVAIAEPAPLEELLDSRHGSRILRLAQSV